MRSRSWKAVASTSLLTFWASLRERSEWLKTKSNWARSKSHWARRQIWLSEGNQQRGSRGSKISGWRARVAKGCWCLKRSYLTKMTLLIRRDELLLSIARHKDISNTKTRSTREPLGRKRLEVAKKGPPDSSRRVPLINPRKSLRKIANL